MGCFKRFFQFRQEAGKTIQISEKKIYIGHFVWENY